MLSRMMPSSVPAGSVDEKDVFAATPLGSAELHGAATDLSAAELEVLVLVDGGRAS
jgi:hypothetical protein